MAAGRAPGLADLVAPARLGRPKEILILCTRRGAMQLKSRATAAAPNHQWRHAGRGRLLLEFLDPGRFPDPAYPAALRDFPALELPRPPVRLVIAMGDDAVEFFERRERGPHARHAARVLRDLFAGSPPGELDRSDPEPNLGGTPRWPQLDPRPGMFVVTGPPRATKVRGPRAGAAPVLRVAAGGHVSRGSGHERPGSAARDVAPALLRLLPARRPRRRR